MLALIRILVATYVVSANVYGFTLIYFQKKYREEDGEKQINDGKLFVAGLVGGATGIYVGMFVLSYRLHSMFLMIVMPILIVFNAYILIMAFTQDFGFVNEVYRASVKNLITLNWLI